MKMFGREVSLSTVIMMIVVGAALIVSGLFAPARGMEEAGHEHADHMRRAAIEARIMGLIPAGAKEIPCLHRVEAMQMGECKMWKTVDPNDPRRGLHFVVRHLKNGELFSVVRIGWEICDAQTPARLTPQCTLVEKDPNVFVRVLTVDPLLFGKEVSGKTF